MHKLLKYIETLNSKTTAHEYLNIITSGVLSSSLFWDVHNLSQEGRQGLDIEVTISCSLKWIFLQFLHYMCFYSIFRTCRLVKIFQGWVSANASTQETWKQQMLKVSFLFLKRNITRWYIILIIVLWIAPIHSINQIFLRFEGFFRKN